MLHLYFPQQRNIKWTSALLIGLLKMTVNNTWIIARHFNKALTLKKVMIQLIKHLAGTDTLRKDDNRPRNIKKFGGMEHWPEETTKNRCRQCQSQKINSKTSYKCSTCNVHLHPTCMKAYHTKK